MKSVILEARALKHHFGSVAVTNDVNLSVCAGDRHAIIGPNGAGKTTLLNLLSGMIQPDDGEILFLGKDITRFAPQARVKLGLVRTFQLNNLFRNLSVLENVYLAASEHRFASQDMIKAAGLRKDLLEAAVETICQLGLADDQHRIIREIPYGRQRLVEFAIGLSLAPRVLLLDEPTAGVPSAEVAGLLTTIKQLPAETAIILIEHDMQVVRRFADQVTVLVGGSIMMTDTPEAVMASDAVRAVYLGQSGYDRFYTGSLIT